MFYYLTSAYSSIVNATTAVSNFLNTQLDLLYLGWVSSLLYPSFVAIIVLPVVIIFLLYISATILYIYSKRRHVVYSALQESLERRDPWIGGRYLVALLWDAHGYIWHGYEVMGLENLPESSGALIVYYHGALPVDIYYLISRLVITKGLILHSVGDKFLQKIPGWKYLLEAFHIHPGTVASCIQTIKEGNILTLSPGGVREALFSDHSYPLVWGERKGFAHVAIKANCPVIPMFTENLRESFRTLCWPRKLWFYIYEKIRFPFVPIFGGFPVKLRTYLGPPIYPLEMESPEELSIRIQEGVKSLIVRHQRIPGNILRALISRFYDYNYKYSQS